jgi:hypothetical protein
MTDKARKTLQECLQMLVDNLNRPDVTLQFIAAGLWAITQTVLLLATDANASSEVK